MLSLVPVAGVPVVAAVPLQLAPAQHYRTAGAGAPNIGTAHYNLKHLSNILLFCGNPAPFIQEHSEIFI